MVAALNKYYRPMTLEQFRREMGIEETQNAIAVSDFPKEVKEWIWEKERSLGEIEIN